MSDGKKRSILRNVLGYYHQAGDELLFACPKCNHHKNKLSVNIERFFPSDIYILLLQSPNCLLYQNSAVLDCHA